MLLEMSVKLCRGHLDLTTQLSMSDARVGLFGKSGAGKSTVLGLIAGAIQPQSGHIVLDGKILFDSHNDRSSRSSSCCKVKACPAASSLSSAVL
jgi:ABC-type sulfate/molybdate transport systems ATPase subunit